MISQTIFYKREKTGGSGKLSLVALMDIFTILVFFLLLNSGEAQKIENAKFVTLPNSTKGDTPHEELTILLNEDELWVGKKKIADLADLEIDPNAFIEPLEAELVDYREKLGELTPFQENNGLAAVIMGDKEVPFVLLKSVMATCRKAEFLNISLAVNHIVDTRAPSPIGVPGGTAPAGGSPVVGGAP